MRFSIYGRYELEVLREGGRWAVYRLGGGGRRQEAGLIVPADIAPAEVSTYLDDMLHEMARPGAAIERID